MTHAKFLKTRMVFLVALLGLEVTALGADGSAQATAKLTGRISVAGVYPRARPLPVFKNRDFCGAQVRNETLLIGGDGGIKNAVVTLRALDRPALAKPKQIILDNQNCAFVPHVQVVPVGSELLLKNSDPILHTVHARLGRETLFNVGLPKWRTVIKRLDRTGVVRIDCDVLHTWMSAAIVVTDSPLYAVSDGDGWFLIDGLAAGFYDLEVWHERLGRRQQRVRVQTGVEITVDVVFAADKLR
jgi:hypothetical protein